MKNYTARFAGFLVLMVMVSDNAPCEEDAVDDVQKRIARFSRETKDARLEKMFENHIVSFRAVVESGTALAAAYETLDLETCVDPEVQTPEKIESAVRSIAVFRAAAQAFGEALVQHRRNALAELERQKIALNGSPRAEAEKGTDLSLKVAESALGLADTAENALKAFKRTRRVYPQQTKMLLASAGAYEAAQNAATEHRERRKKRMTELLPK